MSDVSGIVLDEITAFGDDKNDIDMLKICGTGVAVSNDEDGVAKWIAKNILGEK